MERRKFIKSALGMAAVSYVGGAAAILFPDEAYALSEKNGLIKVKTFFILRENKNFKSDDSNARF